MTTIDSKAEAMSRLADFLIGAEHHYDGQALTILVEGREAIRAYLAALPSPKVEGEPVAWRHKMRPVGSPHWSEWREGSIEQRGYINRAGLEFEEQPLYASSSPVLADEGVIERVRERVTTAMRLHAQAINVETSLLGEILVALSPPAVTP